MLFFLHGAFLHTIREVGMLNPRASSSKPKRKRAEIQCSKLTIGKDEEKDVMKEEIASKDGILSIPMAYSPKNVRSPAIFIHDNASLKKRLVKKVFYKLIIMLRNFYFGIGCQLLFLMFSKLWWKYQNIISLACVIRLVLAFLFIV